MTEVVRNNKTSTSGQTANQTPGSTNPRKPKDKESASKIVQNQLNQQTHKSATPIKQLAEMTPGVLEKEPTQG